MDIKFSKQAQLIIDTIENTNSNVFVTGKAGTGKSTLLEHIRLHSKKKIIVLAPTGIAAININGETIHSFFTLKPGYELDEAKEMVMDAKKRSKFKRLKTLAIDEISMVRADLLDAIDIVLRKARQNEKPFGGVQMVFFGDLFQLPPVVTHADKEKYYSEYNSPYFFDANALNKKQAQTDLFSDNSFKMKYAELKDIYRQKDDTFIEVLNAVRNGDVKQSHLETLNSRYHPEFIPEDEDSYIYLVTTNKTANEINMRELQKLNSDELIFEHSLTGDFARNLYPNEEEITLCIGAQVMFICNDQERRWVNGTIGKVIDIIEEKHPQTGKIEEALIVETNEGKEVTVHKHTWDISKYIYDDGEFKRETMGSFTQIPLKLAWAITIHKSQGKTFDKVIIDLGRGSFAHGQTYVALSRCTSIEGLVLKKPFYKSSVITDPLIQRFSQFD